MDIIFISLLAIGCAIYLYFKLFKKKGCNGSCGGCGGNSKNNCHDVDESNISTNRTQPVKFIPHDKP